MPAFAAVCVHVLQFPICERTSKPVAGLTNAGLGCMPIASVACSSLLRKAAATKQNYLGAKYVEMVSEQPINPPLYFDENRKWRKKIRERRTRPTFQFFAESPSLPLNI